MFQRTSVLFIDTMSHTVNEAYVFLSASKTIVHSDLLFSTFVRDDFFSVRFRTNELCQEQIWPAITIHVPLKFCHNNSCENLLKLGFSRIMIDTIHFECRNLYESS